MSSNYYSSIMPGKDLISIADLSREEIFSLIRLAVKLKKGGRRMSELSGKTIGLIFQKPSTRTAVSFAVGMYQLGGHPLILNAEDLQLRRGESPADTGRTLSRYLDAVMIRANRHEDVLEMARYATVPVINGLTDKEHPCQVLADLLTVLEKHNLKDPAHLRREKAVYLGDGNNVAHSWMLAASIVGMELTLACPERYDPEPEYVEKAGAFARASGAKVQVVRDPRQAARGATLLYTDVWASMGKEDEREHRRNIFSPYQLDSELVELASPNVLVMHCLPAHRGEEITPDAMDGPRSVVFDQAENRLHIQKAILLKLLGKQRRRNS